MWLQSQPWLKNQWDPNTTGESCPRLSTQIVFTAVILKIPLTCLPCLVLLLCVRVWLYALPLGLSAIERSSERERSIKRQQRSACFLFKLSLSHLSHKPIENNEHEQNESESLAVYYQVFNRHRPEMGESNAESVQRMKDIDDEVQRILTKRRKIFVTNNVQEYEIQ